MQEPDISTTHPVEPATRLARLEAVLIDDLISIVPFILIVYDDPFIRFLGFAALISYILLQFTLLSRTGQTMGKRMRRIRIVTAATGENGGFVTNILLRAIPGTIMAVIPFLNLVDILFIYRKDRRCLHDLIAGTIVIEA